MTCDDSKSVTIHNQPSASFEVADRLSSTVQDFHFWEQVGKGRPHNVCRYVRKFRHFRTSSRSKIQILFW